MIEPFTRRITCVICNYNALKEDVHEKTPMFFGTTDADTDLFINAVWGHCTWCGCVQLLTLADPDILYRESHTPGTVGNTWSIHHKKFRDFVIKNSHGNKFMEIGAGTYTLYDLINEKLNTNYTIVDPNMGSHGNVKVINDFFSNVDLEETFDTIIHSHTFEHFYNPRQDLLKIKKLMSDNSVMIMSIPLTDVQLRHGHHNALNLEHTFSIDLSSLSWLFNDLGFSINDIEMFNDYCVFISVSLKTQFTYGDYVKGKHEDIFILNQTDGPIFLFGAHIFSQSLICAGLESDVIAILDNDPDKIGRRLYGTHLKVYHPSIIKEYNDPKVVVRAAQYSEEIIEQLKNINPDVVIL